MLHPLDIVVIWWVHVQYKL